MAFDADERELRLVFRALGDLTRLRILRELSVTSRMSVTDMAVLLRMSQPLLSWHLGILRRARIITTVRAGRLVFYSLNRARLAEVEELFEAFLSAERRTDVIGLEDRPTTGEVDARHPSMGKRPTSEA